MSLPMIAALLTGYTMLEILINFGFLATLTMLATLSIIVSPFVLIFWSFFAALKFFSIGVVTLIVLSKI